MINETRYVLPERFILRRFKETDYLFNCVGGDVFELEGLGPAILRLVTHEAMTSAEIFAALKKSGYELSHRDRVEVEEFISKAINLGVLAPAGERAARDIEGEE